SPDGSTVALGGFTRIDQTRNHPIYLFDFLSGSLTGRLDGLPDVTRDLAFSTDGRFLAASLGGSNGIRVFEISIHKEVFRDTDSADASVSIRFDRRGRLLVASDDSKLRLYGPWPSFPRLVVRSARGGKHPMSANFSPDGALIAVGFDDSRQV